MNRMPRYLLIAAVLLLLGGCASPSQPSRFYRLESANAPAKMPQATLPGESLALVGVGPVRLASYLDRPQMVERSSIYRLKVHEFDRWAGTLQENSVQVLRDVIQEALPQTQVIAYPWHSSLRPEYEVVLAISRFDRQGDKLVLQARWTLVSHPHGRLAGLGRERFEIGLNTTGMEAMAAGGSSALEALGRRIANDLLPMLSDQR